jgi:hypothetical protein
MIILVYVRVQKDYQSPHKILWPLRPIKGTYSETLLRKFWKFQENPTP